MPLLFFKKTVRRYTRDKISKQPVVKSKPRDLYYASHKDAYVFSYYNFIIKELYEQFLLENDLDGCVIGYRSGKGSNIDFAREAFKQIKDKGKCVALGFDISGFFDNLDHERIKQQWCSLLSVERLPKDHFKVYKAITAYSWIDRDECYKRLQINPKLEIPNPLCGPKVMRNKVLGHDSQFNSLLKIKKSDEKYGIPQGTPISATISNIYMMNFDMEMRSLAREVGGVYRRYSDDILWICPNGQVEAVKSTVHAAIQKAGKNLLINDDKTLTSVFSFDETGQLITDKPFQYLGFTFDGKRILIRPQTLSKFYRRLISKVRGARFAAWRSLRKDRKSEFKVFKRGIYRSVTFLGKRNFHTYVARAAKKMDEPGIQKQLRNHWKRVQKELAGTQENEVYQSQPCMDSTISSSDVKQ